MDSLGTGHSMTVRVVVWEDPGPGESRIWSNIEAEFGRRLPLKQLQWANSSKQQTETIDSLDLVISTDGMR